VNADASVGATGYDEAGIALGKNDYLNVGAGGFVGASAGLKDTENLGDLAGVKGDVGVYAGVGAKADIDAGYKDGELGLHLGCGIAFGLGFDCDFGFSVNVGAVADGIDEATNQTADAVADAGKWVGNEAERAVDDICGWL